MKAILLPLSFLLFLGLVPLARASDWKTLKDCRYVPNEANDGDSFHVRVDKREYIFRLYFVDTPETETRIVTRVKQQAKYFHVTVSQTLQIGTEAERFTRQKLDRPFTVRTCLQDARGRSRLPRYFAFLQIDNADLGELLVANGLARVFGAATDPPGMNSRKAEWRKLKRLEREAREQRIGGWGIGAGRLKTRASAQPAASVEAFPHLPAVTPSPASEPRSDAKLDVNSASIEALRDLPGIGLVLAKRPFQSANDLRRVQGIGAKRYEQLRPYFQ